MDPELIAEYRQMIAENERLRVEVERLKGVELALANAEQHISFCHNLLDLYRGYSKEMVTKVDKLIGPEQDDEG